MKLLFKAKDGGPESNVTGYWLIEWKRFFSIALLRFDKGYRENFHSHAFNAWSFVFGELREQRTTLQGIVWQGVLKGLQFTSRNNMHRVIADQKVWALTIRGPWTETWTEYNEKTDSLLTLTHGRKVVNIAQVRKSR